MRYRGVAQFGRALRSGRRGRVFESRRLDFFVSVCCCSLAIVGPSGCGKSTLLHLIAGLLPSEGGSIEIEGKPIFKVLIHNIIVRFG